MSALHTPTGRPLRRMTTTMLLASTAAMLFVGCTSAAERSGDGDTTGVALDTARVDTTAASSAPMRMPAELRLERDGEWLRGISRYTYTNTTGGALYLVNCNGDVTPALQRRRPGGEWENWWGPATNACLSPPVVIENGATFVDTMAITMGRQDDPKYTELLTERDVEYRLVWHQALTSYRTDSAGFGPTAPLELRVSNAFRIILPSDAADTGAAGGDGARPPMRTSTELTLVRDGEWHRGSTGYVYTNRTGAPVLLTNCNGDVRPGIQRLRDGAWEDWWFPVMNECLSAPVVIAADGVYRDSLRIELSRDDARMVADIRASPEATYRLVWHQALASFDAGARPFGPRLPLPQRVSNPFTIRVR